MTTHETDSQPDLAAPELTSLHVSELTAQLPGRQVRSGYLRARSYVVRQEYTRVNGDLIALNLKPNNPYGQRAKNHLEEARQYLQEPDVQAAAGEISQADQAIVRVRSNITLEARANQLIDELQARGLTTNANRLKQIVFVKSDVTEEGKDWSDHRREAAAAVAEAVGKLALCQREEWINDDLQVARLRLLALFVAAAFVVTLGVSAIAANPHPVHGWPVNFLASRPAPVSSVLACFGVAVLGAAGGLFSGLLVTQGARTSLLGYRTSVLRLTLKPMVGALTACVIYIILSWQVVPGITVTNGGTFLVIGFVTGFSERYILRVLNVSGTSETAASTDGEPGNLIRR